MGLSLRLLVLACASVVCLGFGDAAWADYDPRLYVLSERHALGSPTSLTIGYGQSEIHDPTAKADISVPTGYAERFTAAPGAVIGAASAQVVLRGTDGAQIEVEGVVRADDPANHVSNQCAPGSHTAVWILELVVASQPMRIPIYVDDVTTIPGMSARIQFCLAGPIGTPSNAQVLGLFVHVRGVFTNPARSGDYVWSGLLTPYSPGTTVVNAGATVEARAAVLLPVTATLAVRRKGRVAIISGRIRTPASARVVPAAVSIWAGTSPRRLRRIALVFTRFDGTFTLRRRVRRGVRIQYFQARVGMLDEEVDRFGYCRTPPPRAPRGCVSATAIVLEVRSSVRRVRFPRR